MTIIKYSPETTEAISSLVIKRPFFASLLFDLMAIREDPSIPTAATDGKNIIVGDWFRKLSLDERVFVLAHEVSHAIMRHLPRAKMYRDRGFGPDLKPWNDEKFNQAADYYINMLLELDQIGKMPPNGLRDDAICNSPDQLVDDIYCGLPEPEKQEFPLDEHLEPSDDGPSQAQTQLAVAKAVNAAKAVGKMPGGMERIVGELLNPAQPWKQLLRDFVTSSVGKEDTSWARPNRRRLALPPHVPFPGSQGFAMGTMVVAIDTSGSISQDELQAFVTEMSGIIEQVRPRELWVCWWDTKAKMVRIDDIEQLAEERAVGGGGTDYRCVAPAIDDEMVEPEIVICMTDGYVTWPQDFPWQHLTVTTGSDCPFGRNIKMDISRDYADC